MRPSDRLERDLRRIGGKVEWAVKVYRTGEEQSVGSQHGINLWSRLSLGANRVISAPEARAQEQLREQVREIHDALGQVSAEYVRNQPQDAVLSGRKEQMLLNGAYLVSRTDQARFLELVRRDRRRFFNQGFVGRSEWSVACIQLHW